ncbi:MAG: phosphonate C-P lyase system protein PhnG [Acidimicrobiales bacterium]
MTPLDRERRTELLAAADAEALVAVADACLEGADEPEIVTGPEVGMVVLTVREPVEATRFHLGEVLVTRAEVVHRGRRGWSMRMGEDRPGALAAAICDAEVEAGGPQAPAVDRLCGETDHGLADARTREWVDLAPTIVRFEEMGEGG